MRGHSLPSRWQPYPAQPHSTVTGTLLRWARSPFAPTGGTRTVLVHLPPSYADTPAAGRRYPVLYMHDGQNLFDAATSHASEWRVDETMTALAAEGIEAIVVGIHHAGVNRIREYTPFSHAGAGYGQAYIEWLVRMLKPRIDADFRTRPEKQATFIAGSSMGGLISAWAFFAYPLVFGGAGIFSPAFWIANAAIEGYVRRAPFVPGRLYLDHGTREAIAIRPMLDVLEAKGYTRGLDLCYISERGARHTEAAWAARFPNAVRFLLGAT